MATTTRKLVKKTTKKTTAAQKKTVKKKVIRKGNTASPEVKALLGKLERETDQYQKQLIRRALRKHNWHGGLRAKKS